MEFQFNSMSDFFDMGGYAFFVWASFICTFLCMLAILIHSVVVSKKIKQGVLKEKARAQRIMAAREQRAHKIKAKQAAKAAETDPNNLAQSEVNHESKT